MSERSGSSSVGPGTAEIPIVRPPGPPTVQAAVPPSAAGPGTAPQGEAARLGTAPQGEAARPKEDDAVPGVQPTVAVGAGSRPRPPRRSPLMVMGPWAPVAGALLGLLLSVIAVLVLAGTAESFEDRLALVFVVLGLGLLGSAGVLLGDEVRVLRHRTRDAAVRPSSVEVTAVLLNGLTPGRLLLLTSGFVLFLAAYVSR